MQSTDPAIGPENYTEGWRPERNIDPRILVSPEWGPVFEPFSAGVKLAITESLLSAWLDKKLRYPSASCFVQGAQPESYKLPDQLRNISGGKVWEAAQFQAAGVRPALIERLNEWGRASTALAELFHDCGIRDALCHEAITSSGTRSYCPAAFLCAASTRQNVERPLV